MEYSFYYWGKNTKEILKLIKFSSYILILRNWKHSGFMNLGYVGITFPFELDDVDIENKKNIALYVKALEHKNHSFKNILEIGSGLGGGCYVLQKYYNYKDITGTDFLKINTHYYTKQKKYKRIKFITIPAEEIQKLQLKYELIISIEAGLFFNNWDSFINNIKDVLAENGQFIYEDLVITKDIQLIEYKMASANLKIIHSENITNGVLQSMYETQKPVKNPSILYNLLKKIFRIKNTNQYDGYKDSKIYNDLVNGDLVYMKYVLMIK